MGKRNKSRRRRRGGGGGIQGATLAYNGPPSSGGRMRAPGMPPTLTTNLVVRKVFRFVLASSVNTETLFTFTAPKIGALIGVATATTNIVQLFEACKINSITLWSSINPSNVQPRTVSVLFMGAVLGVQGANKTHSDMSVGMTRVAKVKARPEPGSQAGQWQNTVTTNTAAYFSLLASGGAVCDLDVLLTVTSDARPSNASVSITGPAVVTNVYYLALDNNGGGSGSVGNVWTPSPELLTIT